MTARELPVRVTYMQKTAPDDAACASCRWWQSPIPLGPEMGVCRCRAPHRTAMGEYQFPVTQGVDLCGEWEAMP